MINVNKDTFLNNYNITHIIRNHALKIGFDACGFSRARRLTEEEKRLEEWLHQGRHGTMTWMENHFDKRVDPTKLVPGARSVVTVLMSYNQPETFKAIDAASDGTRISKYALGDDYHDVMKSRLFELFEFIRETIGQVEGRAFVDSAPVMDKAWAKLSGLGWIGKNSNLLNKNLGSYYFIGELILDAEFEYDNPTTDHCGSCTRCIDACPTGAIYEPYRVDGSKCISYFTIELRDAIPSEYHSAIGNWMYGCDICQDVCPWNRKAAPGRESRLFARDELLNSDIQFWEELDLLEYQRLFKKSAVKRTTYTGLKRNVEIVRSNITKK
jgi:epoxyqueuosine reductase